MRDFSLEVVSHHPSFKNQTIVPYFVDGIDTIGVWGEEPFELRFRNNTSERVQVRLSVDGTDVLSVEPATLSTSGKMWLVQPHSSLSLKAWPETTEGGAQFIFGKTVNSVAANTHGDLSAKGIISAAVFRETYSPPPMPRVNVRPSPDPRRTPNRRTAYGGESLTKGSNVRQWGAMGHHNLDLNSLSEGPASAGFADSMDMERERGSAPAVGAGETIKQAIGSATGLIRPAFDRIVSMRYIWWDDLKVKLTSSPNEQHPTGFKSATPMANLGNTPRIDRTRDIHL